MQLEQGGKVFARCLELTIFIDQCQLFIAGFKVIDANFLEIFAYYVYIFDVGRETLALFILRQLDAIDGKNKFFIEFKIQFFDIDWAKM